jgi:hypothetical protein
MNVIQNMKNKQKEWHPATKPLKLLTNSFVAVHFNDVNCIKNCQNAVK